jgi:hypothetical protein
MKINIKMMRMFSDKTRIKKTAMVILKRKGNADRTIEIKVNHFYNKILCFEKTKEYVLYFLEKNYLFD